ncbi:MAG: Bug family tripartite tricarboxylate transporter substrate binding protein, partial [Nitrospira sp.]
MGGPRQKSSSLCTRQTDKGVNQPLRRFSAFTAAVLALMIVGVAPSTAQGPSADWPTKIIKVVVPWPAGGNADVWARIIANGLSKSLNQTVVVENRPGAAGSIGVTTVVRAEPDGYTLLFSTPSEIAIAGALTRSLPYDPIRDLQPITQVLAGPYLLVANTSFPPNTLAELVAYVKANPGKVNYASFGENTLNHLYGEMFRDAAGLNVV